MTDTKKYYGNIAKAERDGAAIFAATGGVARGIEYNPNFANEHLARQMAEQEAKKLAKRAERKAKEAALAAMGV